MSRLLTEREQGLENFRERQKRGQDACGNLEAAMSYSSGDVRQTAIHFAVLICSFLFATPTLVAQLRSLDVSQYLHTSWTAQEGFFRGGIDSLAQTPDGYLWLTSAAGLLRFDGVRFVEWKPPGNDPLPRSPLEALLVSKDGSLWIGGRGLAELRTDGAFRRYHELDGLQVEALAEDKDGAIWAGGSSQPGSSPLCRVYRGKGECYGDTKFMGGWVTALYTDQKGRLWAGANDGIWRIRPGPPMRVAPFPSVVRLFAEDANGTLVFSDGGDEVKALTNEGKVKDYLTRIDGKPVTAWAILNDREGALWIATGGQGIVHIHEGRTDRFTTLDGLSFDFATAIIQDREGNVWVASVSGLDKFTKPAVPRLTRKEGLSEETVESVLTDSDGVSWIGTDGGLDELIGGRLITSNVKLPNSKVTSLFETSTGHMLLATNTPNGMVWLEGRKTVPLRAASGENVFEVAEDRHGDLWVVNRESGLLHLRENGDIVETFSRNDLGLRAMLLAFDPIRDGIWLTSTFGELWFFKSGRIVERYGQADGLGDGLLQDPQVDKDGAVWVGTRIGLARLMNGRIAVLGRKNGLPCDAVHWMRRDKDHNVWLYMECGLVSFPERDLSSWIARPSRAVAITHYLDNTAGVQNSLYNGWYTPQTATTKDGRILFTTTSGLSVLDPHNLNQNTLPPEVHIEEITADGREIESAGHVSLPERVRNIHFAYTAPSFAAPRKVRFRYKLEGYDEDWSDPVSVRQATYTNLPPGNYTFRVIACNNDGVWNETGAQLAFTIPPAFTQSLLFKMICFLGFIGLVYLAYRFRIRQVTLQLRGRMYERLAERERIARDLHDTFFQGIQGLLLRFHTATSQLSKEEPARQIFEETLKQSDQVMLEGRELVLDLRATASEQNDLPTAFSNFGEGMRRGSSCDFKVVVNGAIRSLHPVVFEELFKIGKEALSNSFRHSGAHSIEVELNYERSELRIRIRDDGTGIDSTILRQGHRDGHFGLPGMRERAQKVGAHLDVWSKSAAGTEVELRIAARIAYLSERNGSKWKLPKLWHGAERTHDPHENGDAFR
jgi:signal transduction histidine kinase/ligand-binding sensor domain-containing protein